jgi:hypothetical protein
VRFSVRRWQIISPGKTELFGEALGQERATALINDTDLTIQGLQGALPR